MGQDDVSPAIEVGMATCGRLPAIQEGFSRTGTEGGFSSATSGNPIPLFGFGGDLGDELVDGLLHFFWLVCRWRFASDLQPIYTILILRQYIFSNYFYGSRNRMNAGSADDEEFFLKNIFTGSTIFLHRAERPNLRRFCRAISETHAPSQTRSSRHRGSEQGGRMRTSGEASS